MIAPDTWFCYGFIGNQSKCTDSKSVIGFVDITSEQNRSARIVFYYIVNMARNQNIVCVLFICIFNANPILGKVFSRSLSEIRNFQYPHILSKNDNINLRIKRSNSVENSTTTDHVDTVHSIRTNLSTTTFALHGEIDNEAFVHWTGEKNDVSFYILFRPIFFLWFIWYHFNQKNFHTV